MSRKADAMQQVGTWLSLSVWIHPYDERTLSRQNRLVGTWLSLVERTLGVGEVASSNLVVPTIFQLTTDSFSDIEPLAHSCRSNETSQNFLHLMKWRDRVLRRGTLSFEVLR